MKDGLPNDPAPAAKPPSRWGGVMLGLFLGGLIGAGALYLTKINPAILSQITALASPPAAEPTESPAAAQMPVTEHRGLPLTPFEMGALPVDEVVKSVKITLGIGKDGAALSEPVDVHLGLGFPFRLYPLGGTRREPSFAAFPQKSNVEGDSIQSGQMATFEFTTAADAPGDDVLLTTSQLLAGVTCGDLQRIGFASQGRTDWTLEGYRIEVNGRLFAANGLVKARPQEKLAASRESLMKVLPGYEAKLSKPTLTDDEKSALRLEHAQVRSLSGRVTGSFPWWEEASAGFKPAPVVGTKVGSVLVSLETREVPQSGTRCPLYLQAGARKFLLNSEADPLRDESKPQLYEIADFELAINPMTLEALATPGLGIIGSGARAQKIPDRAQIRRLSIEADGKPVYDSDTKPDDKATLSAVWLTPSAHFDDLGEVVRTPVTATEIPLWKSGTKSAVAATPPPPPEPPPPLVPVPGTPPPPPPLWPPVRIVIPIGHPPPPGGWFPWLDLLAELLFPLPPLDTPLISGVRISPATTIVRDGDPVTVNWTANGGTGRIASWRIDLFGVLPHKAVPVLPIPLASIPLTPSGIVPPGVSTPVSRVMPAINRTNIAALLSGAEALYLYVQPRVTALDSFGFVVTSANGSLLPLFPSGVTVPAVQTRRGGVLAPLPPGNAPAPSFQVVPPAPALPLPWAGMPLADPLAVRNAWSLVAEHGSHFGLLFASHENIPGAVHLPAWSTAVRPTGDGNEVMTIRFEGLVPVPAAANGLRAVAHVGFVGGSSPATTGKIEARAELSSGPIRRDMADAIMPFPFGSQPFFTLGTAVAPLALSKATPLKLIDLPLRFDRMTAGTFAGYPLSPLNPGAYLAPSPPAPPWNAATFGFNAAAYAAQLGTGNMYITLTFKIRLTTTDATDAVGVIGVRLVPDNTP
jgi:hypothetical protein